MDSDYDPEEEKTPNGEDDDDDATDDYDVEDDEIDDDESWSDDSSTPVAPKKKNKPKNIKAKKSQNDKNKNKNSHKKRKSSKMSTSTISPEYLNDIKQTFERFDTDNKGRFDIKQLKFAMRALGFEPKKEEIKRITEEYNKDGFIVKDDFMELMCKRIQEKTVNEEIMKAFQLFDTNQNGKITFDDLKRVSNQLGEKITDEELMEMIDEADLNGDKAVDCQEFLRIMKKTFLY